MRVLVCAPGAMISTIDVYDGVLAGLSAHGVEVITYALHGRLRAADHVMHAAWRIRRKTDPAAPKPTFADICYQSSLGLFERLYRFDPDAVLFVSGVLIVPDVFRLVRKRHLVGVLLTESPYLFEQERQIAAEADLVWTHERAVVAALKQTQPGARYLPHAWLPGRHDAPLENVPEVPAHDVVFVGTGFPERVRLLEQVDWTGIDLGLYGNWQSVRPDSPLRPFVRAGTIANRDAAALYRRARIALNLYRTPTPLAGSRLRVSAESLNPRAYELAACGVFTLSERRAEVEEKFGDLVPTFSTATELGTLLRRWLADDAGRQARAARLPACVAEDTWMTRGRQLVADLRARLPRAA